MKPDRSICVYCGSQPGLDPTHVPSAKQLGQAIAEGGYGLVYGGGNNGLMGAVAEGVLEAGGHVTGVIPEFLVHKENLRKDLAQLGEVIITRDMHERKHIMFERADAFVTLPGGIGTLEEVVEIMTWAQLGHHRKPIVLANLGGFWSHLITLIDHMKESGFIHSGHLLQPLLCNQISDILPEIHQRLVENGDLDGKAEIIEKL